MFVDEGELAPVQRRTQQDGPLWTRNDGIARLIDSGMCKACFAAIFHLALCSSCRCQAHDVPRHGWYEPEGQLRGDILADTPVVHNHSCLWFRLQQNCGFSAVSSSFPS